jgi:coenzyme PQQ synthesis protein D (PqqD)
MTYVRRSPSVAARMLGGEMMIMSGQDSTLFTLNPTASAIWNAADGVTPLEQIVERTICSDYEAEPADALRDALELVQGLAAEGILVVSDSPLQEPAP